MFKKWHFALCLSAVLMLVGGCGGVPEVGPDTEGKDTPEVDTSKAMESMMKSAKELQNKSAKESGKKSVLDEKK